MGAIHTIEEIQREVGRLVILALDDEELSAKIRSDIHRAVDVLEREAARIHSISPSERHVWERVNPFLRSAHQSACLFDRVSRGIFYNNEIDYRIRDYLFKIFHISYDCIPIDLVNARRSIRNDIFLRVIGRVRVDEIDSIFEYFFPRLTEARDSIVHAHDRNFGRSRRGAIAFPEESSLDRQYIAAYPNKIKLLSESGEELLFDISPHLFVGMYERILEAMCCS